MWVKLMFSYLNMFNRNLSNIIEKDLQIVPAVVLYGPRQVGKTTVVKQLASYNIRLQRFAG